MTNGLLQDIRYAIRVLGKERGFTLAALLCLALGIGATTAIFTVVNAVVLRPLPYRDPAQLVRVYTEFPNFPGGGLRRFWVSAPEYLELRRDSRNWESLEGYVSRGVNIGGATEPLRVNMTVVTGGLMPMLGIAPMHGRLLAPADDRPDAPLTTVISHGLWQRAFGGDPRIVGREITSQGRKCTVVGIMPESFQFPPGDLEPAELWLPLQIDPAKPGGRASHFLSLLGRMKPGTSIEQARGEMASLIETYGKDDRPNFHNIDPKGHPIVMYGLHNEVVGNVRTAMLMLLGAVAFVLLIACVNVANLLLARAEARHREIAVRTALGAGLRRLSRQFITEGLVLSISGALLGVAFAFASLRLIVHYGKESIPRAAEVGIDWRVLAFTVIVSIVTGVLFGLAPLAALAVRDLHEALKTAGGRTTASAGAHLFRRSLVAGELALALVLLIGAGLMIRAFWKLQQTPVGFNPDDLITMQVALPASNYPNSAASYSYWTRLEERIKALPGIQSAALAAGLPPKRQLNANDTTIEGFVPRPGGPMQNVDYWQFVGQGFFENMGIRLLEGRFFDARDGAGAPLVTIVNKRMALHFWEGQSAIGRRIMLSKAEGWRTIIGVVEDVKNGGVDQAAGTELFVPLRQTPNDKNPAQLLTMSILIRGTGDLNQAAALARREVNALDPALPVARVRTMNDIIWSAQSRPRFLAFLLALFSATALVLAAVGLYGVISYAVAQRTNEIGIRMAMGAEARDVLRLVVEQGVWLALAGIAAGGVGAFALTRLIRGLLFGIDAFDAPTVAAMTALLAVVTLIASYVPARRATRIDPLTALRYE